MPNKRQQKKSQKKLAESKAIEQCQSKSEEKKLQEKPPNTVTIICSHKRKKFKEGVNPIELVPDVSKTMRAIDKLKITITGPHDPPELYVSPEIGKISGGGTFEIPTFIDDLPMPLPGGVIPLFDGLKHITSYLLTKSKEFTVSGFPDGIAPKKIIVYNPIQWEFELNLPPLYSQIEQKKVEFGYKYGGDSGLYKDNMEITSSKSRGDKNTNTKRVEFESKYTIESGEIDSSHQFKDYSVTNSDGSDHQWLSIKNNQGQFYNVQIKQIIEFGKNFIYVIDAFKNTVLSIKAGAYLDYKIKKCFEGGFTAKFGYKEHTNHEAYFDYSLKGNLLLFSATLEVGVGVSAGVFFNAQLFAYGDIELSIPIELLCKPPDEHRTSKSPVEVKVAFQGVCKFGFGGRANAAFFFEYEVKGESGFKLYIELNFFGNPSFDLKAAIEFLGVYYTLKKSIGKSETYGTKQKADMKERGIQKDKDISVKSGLNETMKSDLKDPNIKTLIGRKELGSFSLSGSSFLPDYELEDNQMLDQLKDVLAESEGFFDYSGRLIVIRPKEKESEGYLERGGDHLKGYLEDFITGNVIDYTRYDVVSDKELALAIMNKISEFGDLDRSSKGFEGLLTAIKNHLRKLMGGEPMMSEFAFKQFVSKDLPKILSKHKKLIKA